MPTSEQRGPEGPERWTAGSMPATDDPILVAAAAWQREGWEAGPHLLAALSIIAADNRVRVTHEQILKPHGLTPSRHDALAELFFSPGGELSMGALSRRLGLHPTSITSTVDSLEGRGLAERVAHPVDGRATLARITNRGREVIIATCRDIAAVRCGLGALSDGEALILFELLRKVRARAAEWAAEPAAAAAPGPTDQGKDEQGSPVTRAEAKSIQNRG